MIKLTVIIPTLNEESNVQRALDSAFFADEIIVIDSFSSDTTVDIVSQSDAILFQRKFDDFSSQKNYALRKASNEWIFLLDADEEITEELRDSIIFNLKSNALHSGFLLKRDTFMNERKLHFGGFRNNIVRLFKKEGSFYEGLVHEQIQIDGSIGKLKGNLNHYTFTNFKQFKRKIDHYAQLRASELYSKQKKVTLYHEWIKPFARFVIHYIIKLGCLDGKRGFQFSYLISYGVWKRFQLLKKLNNT
ncbi:Glycosyltransferase involved in cell wall bisynthesis [Tenacibaculum sp. MAR_2009_124]|uniref:glycosyltransferase family 2 protein n=1 Tax=Tenacibaculum sp. MAR_2009_124 TaxID=1250059 RepID=UPI0008985E00|nr:glycosyltransferase family 2 protein [Tenacibaculum sp. MAR_2009_124]SEB42595.1 Glycosyltransferase involved in cell wall bisynthesis [Tenacibaculum sp. MAR_2009_124]